MRREELFKQRKEITEEGVQRCLHCIRQIDANFSVQVRTRLLKDISQKIKVLRDLVMNSQIDGGLLFGDLIKPVIQKADQDLENVARRLERSPGGLNYGWKDEEFCKAFMFSTCMTIFINQDDPKSLALVLYSLSKLAQRDFGDTSLRDYAVDIGTSGVTWRV